MGQVQTHNLRSMLCLVLEATDSTIHSTCWILVIVVVSRILSSSSSSSYFVHFLILALANPEGLAISNIKIHTK
jgi:hypothetical protein